MKVDDVNTAICEGLGLDPSKVGSLVIMLSPLRYPTIEIEMLLDEEDADRLKPILKRYSLVPINGNV